MSTPGRLARNAGYLTLAKVGTLGLNFVAWSYLFRVLGPEPTGQIGVGLALVSYFTLAIALGFDAIGIREAARSPRQIPLLVSHLISIRVVLCIGALLLYVALVWGLPRDTTYKLVLSALGLQLAARAIQLDWVFFAIERVSIVATRDLVAAVLLVVGTLLLVQDAGDVVWAAFLLALAPLLSSLGLWISYHRAFGRFRFAYDRAAWSKLLRPALPLAASALMIEIYSSLDRLMLDALRSTTEAGYYTAAYKVFGLAVVPAAVLYPVFFPSLSNALGDISSMRRQGQLFARALLAFGLPIAIAGPFLADGAIQLISGPSFAQAGPALAVLLVNAGIVHVNSALGTPLMAWDLQKAYMWAVIAGGVSNVILNILLIPSYGSLGAASATAASEFIVGLGLAIVYVRATQSLPFKSWGRTALAAVVGAGIPAYLATQAKWPLWATVLLIGLCYGTSAWALGVVDRPWIREALRRRFARS